MKRILINATQAEELRVAMVNGQRLYDLDIEVPSREQKKSNIYKGKITRIEPSLEAAFVNYGADRHGFLPFKEISKQYYNDAPRDDNGKPLLKDAIKVDQEIIVQIEKEERGNKGAALTSFISLAGRFLVAMPKNPRAGGVSRRIEGEDRDLLKKVMSELTMPEDMGMIVRTAGVGRSTEEMQWDLDYLNLVWQAIEKAAEERKAPFLIYEESDIVVRALRDHYKSDVGEILIDSQQAYDQAHDFMSMVMPNSLSKLKMFDEKLPLFNRFQIENQIESAFSREVTLPSGGAIVIDHTEALTSIDVNSARATKGSDIEETAKNTNLEAAEEIARQLRIRDLGGLIVIDFIDMLSSKNQRETENRLRSSVYDDRARVQIGRISRFGLMEMSRQRLRPSLGESSQIVCPRCIGQGTIRDTESLSLAVLRLLEEESLKDNTGKILARLPIECATYLLNEKRDKIEGIEQRRKVNIVVIPDPKLETPHYSLERVKDNDTHRHESNYKKSYELTTEEDTVDLVEVSQPYESKAEAPAVQRVTPPAPKPPTIQPVVNKPSFLKKIFTAIFGGESASTDSAEISSPPKESRPQNRGNNRNRRPNKPRNNQNRNRSRQNDTSSTEPKEEVAASVSQASDDVSSSPEKVESSEVKKSRNRNSRNRNNRSGNRNNRNRTANPNQQEQDQANPNEASSASGNVAANGQSAPVENSGNQNNESNVPVEKPQSSGSGRNTDYSRSQSKPAGNAQSSSGESKGQNNQSAENSSNSSPGESVASTTTVEKSSPKETSAKNNSSESKPPHDDIKENTKVVSQEGNVPVNPPKLKPAASKPAAIEVPKTQTVTAPPPPQAKTEAVKVVTEKPVAVAVAVSAAHVQVETIPTATSKET
ncbi:MAG: ribonuclease E [Gammaproteobacteria bacterium]|jgi:ribonuclease E